MANPSTCRNCGAALTDDAREGFCPKCLFRLAGAGTLRVTPQEEELGTVIGHYKLLERIGEGGFGAVYVAEQREPVKRRVALKIIKLGMDTKQVVARFEAERQALALMDHPNIARVFDGGATESGRPYFVMELVRGQRITDYCDQQSLSTRERLDLFMQVCHAIQHAHQKGIIHRDIKPSNILVTVVDGRPMPKVIDFGIAKATHGQLTDQTVYTQLHHFIGTPAYMSPEQAALSAVDVDTRSDIYSLGVLLYELLTGHTPFDAKMLLNAGFDEMRRIVREQEPPRPSTRISTLEAVERTAVARRRQAQPAALSGLVRGDLDWIVMKCLEKERARRYETANALAVDILYYLKQEPVSAAAPTLRYRLAKFARRNRAALGTATAFIVLLAAGAGVSVREAIQATRSARHARQLAVQEFQQRQRAMASAKENREHLVHLYLGNGNRLLEAGDNLGALAWFAEALNLDRNDPEKEAIHRLRIMSVIKQSPRLLHMWFHSQYFNSAELSKDGRLVAIIDNDKVVRAWDVDTGKARSPPLPHLATVQQVRFSPDGQRLVTAADKGRLWNLRSGEPERILEHGPLVDACFSPDGRLVATAANEGTIGIWDVTSGRERVPRLRHCSPPHYVETGPRLAFSPDGQRLLTFWYDEMARVWDVSSGALSLTLTNNAVVKCAAFSPNGALIATAPRLDAAHLWDAVTGRELVSPLRHQNMVNHVAFSPDGTRLVSSSLDGTARLWDTRTGEMVCGYADGSGFVEEATFIPDGRQLLLRHYRGMVRLWSTEVRSSRFAGAVGSFAPSVLGQWSLGGPQAASCPLLHGSRPVVAQCHPDGRRVLTACQDGSVRLWDTKPEGLESRLWPDQSRMIISVSASGNRAATKDASGAVEIWDTHNWRRLGPLLSLTTNGVSWVFFSNDEGRLLTIEQEWRAGSRLSCKLWELATEALLRRASLKTRAGAASHLSASPDCQQIALCHNQALECWDLAGSRQLWRITDPVAADFCFSPDTRHLALYSQKQVLVVDAATGKPCYPSMSGAVDVTGVMFNRDGRLLLASRGENSSIGGSARIWETATGKLLLGIGHRHGVRSLAVDRESHRLAIGTDFGLARVYDLASGQPLTPELRPGGPMVSSVAFSPDGGRLATSSGEAVCAWDLATGQALTSPLRALPSPGAVCFLGNSECLAAQVGNSWSVWELPDEVRPAEDVIAWAQLLAGHRVDSTGVLEPLGYPVLTNFWIRLRAKWPADFAFVQEKKLGNRSQGLKPVLHTYEGRMCLVDLSKFYNAALEEDWEGGDKGNTLASLPQGVQILAQVPFDIGGLIQLTSSYLRGPYPKSVLGIPINRKFARLHVLHGTCWEEEVGRGVGAYRLNYADGQQMLLQIVYGEDVQNYWHYQEPWEVSRATIAWTGSNPAIEEYKGSLRLCKRTWENPRPDVEVESIDFTVVSPETPCAPFLIALTVE